MLETREKIDASQLDLKDTVVNISRVTKVVKGGKNLSFSALVVVGDGHGVVGFGVGKAKEVPSAIKKGIEAAKKSLIRVPLQGTTVPHPVLGRFGAGQVLLKPAPDGTGHHRGRRGARGGRVVRDPERADQVDRIGQLAQRGARDVRRAEGLKDPARGAQAARQGRGAGRSRRDDAIGDHGRRRLQRRAATARRSGSRSFKSPIGFNRTQARRCRAWASAGSATRWSCSTRRRRAG